ncbi:hypothetical protein [Nocardia sp. bgisy118]|uniref:hypothetical protein n=1 Tax=Nocardia sp. bgisy118 TaxID=3413786 RepID=UPI003F4A5DB9
MNGFAAAAPPNVVSLRRGVTIPEYIGPGGGVPATSTRDLQDPTLPLAGHTTRHRLTAPAYPPPAARAA